MKSLRIFALIAVLFLLASCSPPDRDRGRVLYEGGVFGLRPSVIEGAPPPVVNDGGTYPFSVSLALENVGESNVGPGTENPLVVARIMGISPVDFGVKKEDLVKVLDNRLTGAKRNYDGTILPGEIDVLTFEELSYQHRMWGSELFRLNTVLCYDYSTHTSVQICLKDDIIEHVQDDTLCRLRDDLAPLNSGAPVHVVEATQSPSGDDKILINLKVQNVDDGVFFSRIENNPLEVCGFSQDNPAIYKLLMVVHPVDDPNYKLSCTLLNNQKPGFQDVFVPQGSVYGVLRMRDNSPKSVSCFLQKRGELSGRIFQDLLEIDLYYRYGELLDIPILVQER